MHGEVVATHELCRDKGRTIINKEHYEGLRRAAPRTRVLLEKAFLERFPDQANFLERFYAQQKINPAYHLRGILELASLYPREALLEAFSLCLQYNTFSVGFIRGVLEQLAPCSGAAGTGSAYPAWAAAGEGAMQPVCMRIILYQRLLEGGESR